MGFLLHILLAVAGLGAAQAGLGLAELPWGSGLVLFGLPYLVAALARRWGQRGSFRTNQLLGRAVGLSAPLGFVFLMLATDWLERVRAWTGAELSAEGWPEFALFLVFAPYPLLQLAALDAETRLHAPPGALRRRELAFKLRMLAAALAPLVLYLYLTAQLGVVDVLRVQVQEVGLVHAAFLVLLLVSLALLLPVLLVGAWDTVPMPPSPQREVLDAVASRASFRPRGVRVWRTGNLMANAAIIGVGDRRLVLFSDSLLAALPPRELAAVYGHEIGHAKRRHVTVFAVWTLGFFLGADWLAARVSPENEWLAVGVLAGALVLWGLGFGWLSRRCELEADLYSLELLRDPTGMVLALERVGGVNDIAGWRHFSTRDRVSFLWRAWSDPTFVRRFRRRLRRVAGLGACLFVLAAVAQVVDLVRSYPEDRVRAELALGHWNDALERARELPELTPGDLALLELGAEKQGDRERLPPAELQGGLEASLATGAEWSRCAEYAGLLVLAGREELVPVARTCEAMAAGEPGRARSRLEDCPDRWRQLLEPRLQ